MFYLIAEGAGNEGASLLQLHSYKLHCSCNREEEHVTQLLVTMHAALLCALPCWLGKSREEVHPAEDCVRCASL